MAQTTHRTFCRFCHANCAMLADVEDGRVTDVRGDPDDPVYGGYTCIKGRQLVEAHYSPERLTASCIKVDGGFEPVSSAAALDHVAERIHASVARYGPDSIAVYCGTYAFQNSAGVGAALAFCKGLGTRHFYTSVTLDQPAKVYTALQYGSWEGGLQGFATADVAFFIGNNPIVSHYGPPGGLPPFSPSRRLRDAIEKGLKLIVADPRASDVAKLAHIHLPVKPGEDPALLAGMLNVIIRERLFDQNFVAAHVDGFDALTEAVAAFTPAIAAERAGVDPDQLIAAARLFAAGPRGVVSTGTGPEMAGNGTLTQYLVSSLNIVCARFCHEGELASVPRVFTPASPRRAGISPPMTPYGDGYPKSRIRGLTHLGMEMPCNVLADEILTPGDGQVKVLVSIGGNPLVAFPDQDKMARALASLDLLVSVDVKMSATTKRADVVIAPKMSLERDDITNLSEWWFEVPYARYTQALAEPPGDVLDEYEILWGIAKRLGTDLPLAGGPCPMDACPDKATFLDLMSAGCLINPSQVRDDTPDGAAKIYHHLHPVVGPAEAGSTARFDLAAGAMPQSLKNYAAEKQSSGFPFKMVSRRSRHRFNSTGDHLPALKAKRMTNPAHIHPDDLKSLAVEDGDIVKIESKAGSLFAVVKASADMRPGVVSLAHAFGDIDTGFEGVRTAGNSTNRLVSETVDYDPVTGQSLQSAIPVRISAA
jgi:anaerobic selenocysteine-containing dehydrogenase